MNPRQLWQICLLCVLVWDRFPSSNAAWGDDQVVILASVLVAHPSIVQLNLGANSIRTRGLTALLPIIQHKLEKGWLYTCSFSDDHLSLLLSAVMLSERLVLCDFRYNALLFLRRHESAIAELRPQLELDLE
jgi:hypothetical protein